MKKYIISLIAVLFFTTWGCQDELGGLFPDPNVYEPSTEVIPKLAARVYQLSRDMNNVNMSFYQTMGGNGLGWPVRTHITNNDHSGSGFDIYDEFASSMPTVGTGNTYNYNRERYRAIPELESRISRLPEEQKEGLMTYIHTIRILWLETVLKSVDLYNSVPYFEAMAGAEGQFYPKFDDPWEIYKDVMARLKEESDNLSAAYGKLSTEDKAAFEHHDIYFEGDVSKWIALAEAYRLRAAVRVSGVYQDEASTVISDVLSRGKLPTIDLQTTIGDWLNRAGGGLARKGNVGKFHYWSWMGPEHMYWLDVNRNKVYDEGEDDPRLPIFALPNREGLYQPVSYDYNVANAIRDSVGAWNNQDWSYTRGPYYHKNNWYREIDVHLQYDAYSHWHGLTFIRSAEPECYFSIAELELLLCEIAEKGLASTGKSAQQHMEQAVINSINYWYGIFEYGRQSAEANLIQSDLNGINFVELCLPEDPSAGVINGYAQKIAQQYANAGGLEDKMEILMQQKFLTLNLHDVMECYTEFRRTRHPVLCSYRIQDGSVKETKMVERQVYPADPASYNTENFEMVRNEDDFVTPIFWVPQDKRGIQPYQVNDWAFYVEYEGIPETFKK